MADQGRLDQRDWPTREAVTEVTLQIPARLELLPVLGAGVREYCATLPGVIRADMGTAGRLDLGRSSASFGYSHFVYSAELILQEAASNIIRHGYGQGWIGQFLHLTLGIARLPQPVLLMELRDAAPPFDPTQALWNEPDPLEPRESGYGIYLIRKLTDGVSYRYQEGYNCLRMLKYIENPGPVALLAKI